MILLNRFIKLFNIIFLVTVSLPAVILSEENSKLLLTIYKDNLAVIKEIRKFGVEKGLNKLRIDNIPEKIDPSSIIIKPVEPSNDIELIEKQYNYNIIEPRNFLEKNIGKDINVLIQGDIVFRGRLVKTSEKEIIIKDQSDNLLLIYRDKIININLSSEDESLLSKPVIDFFVNSKIEREVEFEISYLTENISWKAKYLSFLQDNENVMEIYPFAVINNRAGINYKDAEIKLISGEISRITQPPLLRPRALGVLSKETVQVPQFEEKGVFEYYSYTLNKEIDLFDNSIKEFLLIPQKEVSVTKNYIYDGARNGESVIVNFIFKNTKSDGFGSPIPSGEMKIFKVEKDNFLVLLGEYPIGSAPVGKEVNIQAGIVFDITGERIQKEIKRISSREREEIYQITVMNSKDTQEEVTIVEHPTGDWNIIESTHEYIKKDVRNIEFKLKLKPSSEETLNYTIRYR